MANDVEVNWSSHGTNVDVAYDDEYIYTRVPIGEEARENAGPSKSGKTNVLGSTNGFVKLPGGVSVSLNVVYKP